MEFRIKVTRKQIENYCIEMELFDAGTKKAYEKCLLMAGTHLTADDVIRIMQYIIDHTSKKRIVQVCAENFTPEDQLPEMMARDMCLLRDVHLFDAAARKRKEHKNG